MIEWVSKVWVELATMLKRKRGRQHMRSCFKILKWCPLKKNKANGPTDWNHDSITLNDTPSSGFTSKPTCHDHKLKPWWSESPAWSKGISRQVNVLQQKIVRSHAASCWSLNLRSASRYFFWGSELSLSTSACLQQKGSVSTGIHPEIQAICAISWSHQSMDREDKQRWKKLNDKWW